LEWHLPDATPALAAAEAAPEAAAGAAIDIPEGAKVKVATGGEVDLSGLDAEDGSVTLEGSGTLKLPAPNTAPGATQYEVAQIDYNDSSITINAGGSVYMVSTDNLAEEDYYIGPAGTPSPKYTWAASDTDSYVEFKADGEMVLTGNLTSADDNAINTKVTINDDSTLTVAKDTELTMGEDAELVIEGTVKVEEDGTLDLAKFQTVEENGKVESASVTLNGTIEVESGGTFIAPEPGYPDAIDYGENGEIKLYKGSNVYIGNIPYIVNANAATQLSWTDGGPAGGYVIIDDDGMTLGGRGELSNLKVGFYVTGKVTIEEEAVLTIGPTAADASSDASIKLGNAAGSGPGGELILANLS
jgi:hypothetical protein